MLDDAKGGVLYVKMSENIQRPIYIKLDTTDWIKIATTVSLEALVRLLTLSVEITDDVGKAVYGVADND